MKSATSEPFYATKHRPPKMNLSRENTAEYSEYVLTENPGTVENRKMKMYKRYKTKFKVYSYLAAASGGLGWIYPPSWLITVPTTIMAIHAGRKMNGMDVFEKDHLDKINMDEKLSDTTWVDAENYRIMENLDSGLKSAINELKK